MNDPQVDRDIEVTKNQKLVLIPVQQMCDLHVMVQSTINESYTLITYDLTNYNQIDSFHRGSQKLDPKKIVLTFSACKAFSFNNRFSILFGEHNNSSRTWKTKVYSLDTESQLATWKLVSNFSPSISELLFDFHNCFVMSHKIDEIIIVSIVKDRIIFYIISKSISGNIRNLATFTLRQLYNHTAKFIMQSCIVVSNYIYCSLLHQGMGAKIYQFKLQQKEKTTKVWFVESWYIEDSPTDLQNCFMSVHYKEVLVICCKIVDNKTILEVRRLKSNPTAVLSPEFNFTFPYKVKIITVSVVPCCESLVFAVIYHNNETNKCCIKRIDMSHILESMQT